jgi:uncharacterized protein YkwD
MKPAHTVGTIAVIAAILLSASSAAAACADRTLEPTSGNGRRVQHAVLCLVNEHRRARRLPALTEERHLRLAAARYSRLMVRLGFFAHVSPSGSSFIQRIVSAGYRRWTRLAENLGWGDGLMATPEAIVQAWMASPPHRHNLLDPRLRQIGVGIAAGAPAVTPEEVPAATYTADFGTR